MLEILTKDLERRDFLIYSAATAAWGFLSYAGLGSVFAAENMLSKDKIVKIDELKTRLKSDGYDIDSLINNENFEFYERIERLFKKNPENETKKTYSWYRQVLKLEDKIKKAPAFMAKHEPELKNAEQKFDVDKNFIVGILGIESGFTDKKQVGRYKAFNALVTQYVIGRKKFAVREIKELIKFTEKTKTPIFDLYSSYAGAIGYAQFIPSSLNSLFVGKEGITGKANPMDMDDCIHSIAHYLKESGWDNKQSKKTHIRKSRNWKAIFAYNHSSWYVKAVTEIAYSFS